MAEDTRPTTDSPSSAAGLAVAALGLVVAALPTFLVGGLAVQIRADLGFSETALGAAVTASFLTGAIAAPLVGPITDRLGARVSVATGAAFSVAALVGIATLATGWWVLAGFLVLAGLGFSFTDPGLAVLVTRSVSADRHGFAFGLKEASIPAATLLAGLAVPAIALTVGWRWAFVLGLGPVAALVGLLWRATESAGTTGGDDPDASEPGPPRNGAVYVVALAAALGSAAASGVGVFLTESGVAMGLSPSGAGLLLATGSVAGIATRLGTGVVADRRGGPQLGLMAAMLVGGAAAMALGAIGTTPLLVVGAVGAFSGGWGWSGLLFLSLVRAEPASPGAVAAIGMSGLGFGNALGPLGFGFIAQSTTFGTAWLVAAVAAGVAAVLTWSARHRI